MLWRTLWGRTSPQPRLAFSQATGLNLQTEVSCWGFMLRKRTSGQPRELKHWGQSVSGALRRRLTATCIYRAGRSETAVCPERWKEFLHPPPVCRSCRSCWLLCSDCSTGGPSCSGAEEVHTAPHSSDTTKSPGIIYLPTFPQEGRSLLTYLVAQSHKVTAQSSHLWILPQTLPLLSY